MPDNSPIFKSKRRLLEGRLHLVRSKESEIAAALVRGAVRLGARQFRKGGAQFGGAAVRLDFPQQFQQRLQFGHGLWFGDCDDGLPPRAGTAGVLVFAENVQHADFFGFGVGGF